MLRAGAMVGIAITMPLSIHALNYHKGVPLPYTARYQTLPFSVCLSSLSSLSWSGEQGDFCCCLPLTTPSFPTPSNSVSSLLCWGTKPVTAASKIRKKLIKSTNISWASMCQAQRWVLGIQGWMKDKSHFQGIPINKSYGCQISNL